VTAFGRRGGWLAVVLAILLVVVIVGSVLSAVP